jgi:acyl-CoA oxidase
MQMATIAPHLANGMVLLIVYKFLSNLNRQSDANISNGNFKLLPMLHHVTAGLKALSSEMQYVGCDELRQSCGGAGFSLASGISLHWLGLSPNPTYEGVNVLMFQQSARLLLSQMKLVESG